MVNRYQKGFRSVDHIRLYRIWLAMRWRCIPGAFGGRHDKRYSNRGIAICAAWQEWPIFLNWALEHGYADNLEIDRQDNDAGYCPINCRFVDHKTQNKNRDLALAHAGIRAGQTRRWANPFSCVETKEVFLTQTQAARKHSLDRKSLRNALSGKQKRAGGLHWKYMDANTKSEGSQMVAGK